MIFPLTFEMAGQASALTHLSQLLQLPSMNSTGGFLVKPLINVQGAFDIITAVSFLSNASGWILQELHPPFRQQEFLGLAGLRSLL